jgi:outer membrane protein insertion porin family
MKKRMTVIPANIVKKIRVIISCLLLAFILPAMGDDDFVIQKIEIRGLQRIPAQTVMEYLPVHVGQTLASADTSAIIQSLYQTGFFSDVSLGRDGNTLVIQVSERATIGLIKISGNKQIKTQDLMKALKQSGIAEGEPYDQATLEAMKRALIEEYHRSSHYDASVDVKTTEETRNRLLVDIEIHEGKIAKVKKINIIGNKAFTTKQLLKNFTLGKKPWWAIFSSKDEYSEEKLQADLKSLQEFYLDHGYLRFKVDSQDVEMTTDKKSVIVNLTITEGAQYRIKGYTFSGNLLGQEMALSKLVTIKPGQVFSRKKVIGINDAIGRLYGDQGYAFAESTAVPDIDDVTKQVFLTFDIMPKQRVYVRDINYTGNTATGDEVLRRETRQMEGGAYSISKQDETKRRLDNLGYLENVESKMQPIADEPNQVDLNYSMKETSSTTASAQFGYSDAYGFLYGANITQKNFRGTGKTVSLGFSNSQDVQTYSFNYFNPYYTDSGISRGFSLYFQHASPEQDNVTSYSLDSYGGMMNYRMPMSEYDYLSYGYGYEYLLIKPDNASTEVNDFIDDHGDHFNNAKVTVGWTHNTYDRAILPTKGVNQWLGLEAGLPIFPDSLDYYRLSYQAALYQPIVRGFILELNTNLGYGNGYSSFSGDLPFFKNFYAGGMGTVRGFESNSLGPKDSLDNAIGGNILTTGSVNLIVPNPISVNHLRTSVFLDGGNVFQDSLAVSDFRYSSGVEVDWASPMGLLKVSLGEALNAQDGDHLQFINFSIGTSF